MIVHPGPQGPATAIDQDHEKSSLDKVSRAPYPIFMSFANRRFWTRPVMLVLLASTCLLAALPAAQGRNVQAGDNPNVAICPGTVCLADGFQHSVVIELSSGSRMDQATRWSLDNSYETVVNILYNSTHANTTDAVYVSTTDGSAWARYECRIRGVEHRCDHAHIFYNGDRMRASGLYSDSANDVAFQRSTACHETGHSFGLTHWESGNWRTAQERADAEDGVLGCMKTGTTNADTFVRAHNVAHIDALHPSP